MLKSVSSITNAIGALNFKGTWDANANSPALASSVGTKGDYYVVGTAGSTNLNGISNWGVGDLATFNGSVWQRVEGGADLNGVNLSVSGTSTLSGLTASTALALNASKEIVSITNTGTGNNVLATSPTLVTPALGTPSSGTVTNLTGTASININGTVGATTANTGAFTTLNTSGTVVFNDAGNDVDFRVEGDTAANLLFVDASTDKVGIGEGAPTDRLTVTGGDARVNGPSNVFFKLSGAAINEKHVDFYHDNTLAFEMYLTGGNDFIWRTRVGGLTERLRIDSTGGLILAGSTAQKATGTTWSNPSDERLKNNIRDYDKGIAELMQVRVREWEYNGKGGTVEGTKGLGVVADEVMVVLPDTVENYKAKLNADDEETTAIKKFDATEITWLLVKSLQEQQAQIETLKAEIASLKGV